MPGRGTALRDQVGASAYLSAEVQDGARGDGNFWPPARCYIAAHMAAPASSCSR